MKRNFSFIVLLIFVCVSVFTPVGYAQLEIQGKMVGERIEVADLEYSSGNNEELGKILENNNRDLVDDLLEDSLGKNVDQGLLTQEYDQNSNDVVVGVSDDFEESKGQDEAEVGSSLEVVLKSSKEITIQEVQENTNSFSDEVILEGDEVDLGNLNLASIDDYGSMNIAVAPQAEQIDNAEITVQLEGNDMEDFTFREISVEFADGEYYTLMDRNLGAKEEFNGDLDNPNELSFGYFYQYGNNHGFSWRFSGSSGFAVGSNESLSTDVLLEDEIMGYGPGGENGYYSSNIFIYGSGNWYEGSQQLWGDWKNTDQKQIKGPCPDGWHVPTSREIMNIRGADAIVSLLKMPFAGFRYYKDGVFYNGWRTFKTSSNETVDAWSFLKFMTVNGGYVAVYQTIDDGQKLEEKNIKIFSNFSITDKNGNIKFQLKGKDSANGAPVRCFKNYNYITFDSNGGIGTGKQKVDYGRTGNKPENPTRDGYYFIGWYEDPTYSGEVFDFTTPIENDITLYARRGEIIYNDGDITYTDTNGKVFSGMGTITFTDGEKSITMLDRNLGATATGTGEDSYGYYFQWGNNYGFAMDENPIIRTGYENTFSNKWNNPYVSEIFGKDVDGDNYGGWDKPLNNSLWGGENGEIFDYMRQGPCPENYHVPSVEEWNKVLEYLANIRGYDLQYENGLAYYGDELMDLDPEVLEDFTQILRLPNAGYRDYNGFSEGLDFLAEFWTSSLLDSKAAMLTLTQEYIDGFGTVATVGLNPVGARSVANSVRCFADTYEEGKEPLVLYYDTDEGSAIQAQSIPAGENGYLPGYTTHRNDDEKFLGWFNEDMTKEYTLSGNTFTNLIMSESLAEDGVVTVYAKWGHKVTFLDYDGTVLNVQAVLGGKSAVAPSDPSRNGYTFYGWDKDITNVTGDIEVVAQYTEKSSGENSGRHSGGGGGSSSNKVDNAYTLVNEKDIESLSTNSTKMDAGDYTSTQLENDKQDSSDKNSVNNGGTKGNNFTLEFNEAYDYAKQNGITTKPSIESANMYGNLTRIQMAKMLSNYAINVMGLKPDESRVNKFKDVSDKLDVEYDNAVTLSYQLGIMGINMPNNKFRPHDYVPRAEFVAAFSRMLFKTSDGEYESTSKYYTHHMEKLKSEKILTNDNPTMIEHRGYVMIMLMRSVK